MTLAISARKYSRCVRPAWQRWSLAALHVFIGILILLYFAFMPCIGESYLYHLCLFHPMRYPHGFHDKPPVVRSIAAEDVYFCSANGRKLHGWFYQSPGASKTALICHGNGGNITYNLDVVSIVLNEKVSAFLFDYQGYGRSEGTPSTARICEDGLAAFNYLREVRRSLPENIILYGRSLGTGVACEVSSRVNCGGIILEAPFISAAERGREAIAFLKLYPDCFYPLNGMNNASALTMQKASVLILHGEKDAVIPVLHGRRLFSGVSRIKTKLVTIPGAGHGGADLTKSPQYLESVHAFLTGSTS